MERYFGSLDLQTNCTGEYEEPVSVADVRSAIGAGPAIARGAGVSFVGASFGDACRTVATHHLDRVLSFDPEQLRVTVEPGISLGELYNFLVPRGLYLTVQPGHPQISVGGCVGSNVHGKNPFRDGVFADVVAELELFHPDHGVLRLSREQQPDLFELTCGGFGLTGIILSVTLRLKRLPSTRVEVRKKPVRNLVEACEQVESLKDDSDFLYAWADISHFDARLGRGYICRGRFVVEGGERAVPCPMPSYGRLPARTAPPRLPRLFQPWILPWVTEAHFRWETRPRRHPAHLFDILYPGMHTAYYFDIYGRSGFFAHMVLLPIDRWRAYIGRLENVFREHRVPITALAIKAFDGTQRLLTFNGTGFSLHSHIPNSERGRALLSALEDLSRDFGLIRTIYFDSRLTASEARSMYPEYDDFKQRLHLFDPRRRFVSSLSRRLGL